MLLRLKGYSIRPRGKGGVKEGAKEGDGGRMRVIEGEGEQGGNWVVG